MEQSLYGDAETFHTVHVHASYSIPVSSVGYLHPQDSQGQLATASALGSLGQDNRESGQGGRVHVIEHLPEVVGVLFLLGLALRLGSGPALGTAPRCDRLVNCTANDRHQL
jgi:hypothetical protein